MPKTVRTTSQFYLFSIAGSCLRQGRNHLPRIDLELGRIRQDRWRCREDHAIQMWTDRMPARIHRRQVRGAREGQDPAYRRVLPTW